MKQTSTMSAFGLQNYHQILHTNYKDLLKNAASISFVLVSCGDCQFGAAYCQFGGCIVSLEVCIVSFHV